MERPRKLFKVSFIILGVKNMQKRVHGNDKKSFPRDLKKCPGSLHLPLLTSRIL